MKKVISISLTFLMLAAILHFSVATHFCCGRIAATTISFSGKLATCGMEGDETDLTPTGLKFATHCCDNVLTFYGVTSNYFPTFSYVQLSYQIHFQYLSIPAGIDLHSLASVISIYTSVSPPGASVSNSVDLSTICVYRI